MSNNGPTAFQTSISSFQAFYCGLSSDELRLYNNTSTDNLMYYTNSLTRETGRSFWPAAYNTIYVTNSVIEGLPKSKYISTRLKNQLLGEAKFMRAYCYFYLVNLYGDVPLVLSSDYRSSSLLPRNNKNVIYGQIVEDLLDAKQLLSSQFININDNSESSERISPTRWAAIALLARTYLYMMDYVNAEKESTEIIDQNQLFNLVSPEDVFLKNSEEAIWQLQPVKIGWNTEEARTFILTSAGPTYSRPASLNPMLVDRFEAGDKRKNIWIKSVSVGANTYYFPFKYRSATQGDPVTEYSMILRLGEQYLIRAESRINQPGKISEGIEDLNVLRTRARSEVTVDVPNPLPELSVNVTKEMALQMVSRERQFELFLESGHRWLDLKRTGSVDTVMGQMTPIKGGTWSINWQWYPIPNSDIQSNPNLIQNDGY
jgi:hypothetical protein